MYTTVTLPASPRAFQDRIYAGEVLRLDGMPAFEKLIAYTHDYLEGAFHPHHPTEIHAHLTHSEQVERFGAVSRDFTRADEIKRLWRGVFAAVGFDLDTIARDRLVLRFQPPIDRANPAPRTRGTATVPFHRDSWGTNLYAQTNWWAPVYPVAAGRTLAIYPGLWSKPVPNTTAAFDFEAVSARAKNNDRMAVDVDELLPHPLGDSAAEPSVPVLIEPGSVIVFSSAHAHAGIANYTGVTRISLETRTLLIDDVRAGRGAPNLDGAAPWMVPGLFRRVGDGVTLNEILGMPRLVPYARPAGDNTRKREEEDAKRHSGL